MEVHTRSEYEIIKILCNFYFRYENKTNFKNLKLPKNINFKYKIKTSQNIYLTLSYQGEDMLKLVCSIRYTALPVPQLELVKNFKLKFNVSYLDFHSKLKYKLVDKLIAKYTYKFD